MRGQLDFSESERYLPRWELKRAFIFEQMEEDSLLKLKTMRQALHSSAAAYGTAELYKHHFEQAVAEVKGIGELLFPWIDWETDEQTSNYQKVWEDWFGIKVGSPEWEEIERQGEVLHEIYKQGTERGKKLIT